MKTLFLGILLLSTSLLYGQTMFDICPLKVGTEIPSALIKDKANKELDLKNIVGEKPTVIIFYRGAWCGYCTKHLAELNAAKAAIEKQGYQIFGVTMDKPSKLKESNKKANSEITVYSDAKANAIKAFGLDWKVDDKLFTKY